MKILKRKDKNKSWDRISQQDYKDEAELQDLIYEDPSIIPVDEVSEEQEKIKVAIKEYGLPGAGSSDIIGIDRDGNITIIETKLAVNPEIKRKVLGQILEYASFLWKKTYEQFNATIEEKTDRPLLDQISDLIDDENWSEENFRRNVSNNLHQGNFSLFIVVDDIDDSLKRILEFVNSSSFSGPQIYAFAARYYEDEQEREVLVPQIYGTSIKERESREAQDRDPNLTYEQLEEMAEKSDVEGIYKKVIEDLTEIFDQKATTRSSLVLIGLMGEDDSRRTILSFLPEDSSSDKGLRYKVYIDRFSEYFKTKKGKAIKLFPNYEKDRVTDWAGEEGVGYFQSSKQINKILSKLN